MPHTDLSVAIGRRKWFLKKFDGRSEEGAVHRCGRSLEFLWVDVHADQGGVQA